MLKLWSTKGKCAVVSCDKRIQRSDLAASRLKLYAFPIDPDTRRLWLHLCGLPPSEDGSGDLRICSEHFTPAEQHAPDCPLLCHMQVAGGMSPCSCRLSEAAVPSLELPPVPPCPELLLAVLRAQERRQFQEADRRLAHPHSFLRAAPYCGAPASYSEPLPPSATFPPRRSLKLDAMRPKFPLQEQPCTSAVLEPQPPFPLPVEPCPFVSPPMLRPQEPQEPPRELPAIPPSQTQPPVQAVKEEGEDEEDVSLAVRQRQQRQQRASEAPRRASRKLCRVCARVSKYLVGIFSEEGLARQLPRKIQLCLPITVSRGDALPLTICNGCLARLEQSHALAASCLRAQLKLASIFQPEQRLQASQEAERIECEPDEPFEDPWSPYGAAHSSGSSEDSSEQEEDPPKQQPRTTPHPKRTAGRKRKSKRSAYSADPPLEKKRKRIRIRCKHCNDAQVYITWKSYSEHLMMCHNKYACERCPHFECTGEEQFTAHRREGSTCPLAAVPCRRNPDGSVGCTLCSKVFPNEARLRWHMVRHKDMSERKVYLCADCGRSFEYKSRLKWHMKVHTGEREYLCSVCGKSFHSPQRLKCHSESHGARKNQCPVCSKMFLLKRNLTTHITNVHNKQWRFQCVICKSEFSDQSSVTEHVDSTHTTHEKLQYRTFGFFKKVSPFHCAMCDKYFGVKEHLTSHNHAVHEGRYKREGVKPPGKAYLCDVCGKACGSQAALKIHSNVHLDVKDFRCHLCPKSFSVKQNLDNHIRRHTGEEPYPCPKCAKRFSSMHGLKAHLKHVHVLVRAHVCQFCNKGFKRADQMRIHERIHTNERPYACSICGRRFTQQHDMKLHERRHGTVEYVTEGGDNYMVELLGTHN